MADDRNENRVNRMDLNLYLGLPRSPRIQSSDLGSDLALSSLPLSNSSSTDMPYSPSHATYTPDSNVVPPNENATQGHAPYLPSHEPYTPIIPDTDELGNTLPTLHETEEPVSPIAPSYIPLDTQETNDDDNARPYIPPMMNDVATSMYAPTLSSYLPRSPSYSPPLPSFAGRDDESSSRRELFESPAFRLRSIIESEHRLRLRRFRTSLPYNRGERSTFDRLDLPSSEQQVIDMMSSQRTLETNRQDKDRVECMAPDNSEDAKEEKTRSAANFECNICFDMAQEPVVTSCGHLFCWPCLYQWLNVHSEHKECPVCKGEVTESNITPIYGRGNSEVSEEKTTTENGGSDIKIPPRPHGNRLESLRQQFLPISRRHGEGMTSWRRLVNQQMRSRTRFEGNTGPAIADGTRLRPRRAVGFNAEVDIQTIDNNTPITQTGNADPILDDGYNPWVRSREGTPIPQNTDTNPLLGDGVDFWSRGGLVLPIISDTPPIFRDGGDFWHGRRDNSNSTNPWNDADRAMWHRVATYSLYANDDIRRVVGNSSNRYGASSSSINPSSPEQVIIRNSAVSASTVSATAADQVSASSTTAIIQGDVGVQTDPNSVGSSRSHRRRGRSSTSDYFDVNGVPHANKRRRLN